MRRFAFEPAEHVCFRHTELAPDTERGRPGASGRPTTVLELVVAVPALTVTAIAVIQRELLDPPTTNRLARVKIAL